MQHYLDHHATTPLDPSVAESMVALWGTGFGNPASVEHARGLAAADRVEHARQQVASALGAEAREIVFTSGATEANNMAVLGAARFRRQFEGRDRLVVFETEHSCVLGAARALRVAGFEVVELGVDAEGFADLTALEAAVDERTALVCLMLANNEVGTLQPVAEATRIAHAKGAWVHSDAAQAAGKLAIDVRALDVDLLSISGHKIYGPMGVGALFVRRRPRVRLEPLVHGGGQERGLRAGTLPLPLVAGLGAALALAQERMVDDAAAQAKLRAYALDTMAGSGARFSVNGPGDEGRRLPGNLSLSFPDIPREALFAAMADRGVAVSSGSACSSHDVAPSHVLTAMGIPGAVAQRTLRLGLGRGNTLADIDALVEAVRAAHRKAA